MRRHTVVGLVMPCAVLEGGDGHHTVTKATPRQAYQCKQEGQAWGIIPHLGFLTLLATRLALLHAPRTSIQRQLQQLLASCRELQVTRKRRRGRTHRERSLSPSTVVAKCGGFAPNLALILSIVPWRTNVVLGGLLLGGLRLGVASDLGLLIPRVGHLGVRRPG